MEDDKVKDESVDDVPVDQPTEQTDEVKSTQEAEISEDTSKIDVEKPESSEESETDDSVPNESNEEVVDESMSVAENDESLNQAEPTVADGGEATGTETAIEDPSDTTDSSDNPLIDEQHEESEFREDTIDLSEDKKKTQKQTDKQPVTVIIVAILVMLMLVVVAVIGYLNLENETDPEALPVDQTSESTNEQPVEAINSTELQQEIDQVDEAINELEGIQAPSDNLSDESLEI